MIGYHKEFTSTHLVPLPVPYGPTSLAHYAWFAEIYVEFQLIGCFVARCHRAGDQTSPENDQCTFSRRDRNGSPLARGMAQPPGARSEVSPLRGSRRARPGKSRKCGRCPIADRPSP